MSESLNKFISENDRVIIYDEFGEEVAYNDLDINYAEGEDKEELLAFLEIFEVVTNGNGTNEFLSSETSSYGEGLEVMSIIRRKSDGRLFGYEHWSNGGYSSIEPNGDEHNIAHEGSDDDYSEAYVWLPVEPFTVTGYKFPEK